MTDDLKDDGIDEGSKRQILRMSNSLEEAALFAVFIKCDRELFLECAGKAFDYMKGFRDHVDDEDA